jgi:hypothetical protein
VVILILLIAILTGIFCCYNDYRRRQRRHSSSLNNTIEQIQQEPPLLDTYCQSLSRPPSPSSAPHFWMSTIRRWKNFRQGLPPDDHTRIAQSAAVAVPTTTTITATEEPPAYEGIPFIGMSFSLFFNYFFYRFISKFNCIDQYSFKFKFMIHFKN